MNLYIVSDIETQHYHSGGGAVILAETYEAAKAMAAERDVKLLGDPIASFCVGDTPAAVWIFPDKGCC